MGVDTEEEDLVDVDASTEEEEDLEDLVEDSEVTLVVVMEVVTVQVVSGDQEDIIQVVVVDKDIIQVAVSGVDRGNLLLLLQLLLAMEEDVSFYNLRYIFTQNSSSFEFLASFLKHCNFLKI